MLSAIGKGLSFILKKPGVYITGLVLTLVQGGVFLLADPYLQPLVELGTFEYALQDPVAGIIAVLALLLNLSISIYLLAWVSHQIHSESNVQLGVNALRLSVLLLLAGGAWVFVSNALAEAVLSENSIISIVSLLLALGLGILTLFALVKWMFTFSYLGTGASIKEALAQSWHFTQGKGFHALALGIILLVITTLLSGIQDLVLSGVSEELFLLGVGALFQSLAAVYGAAVLGSAIQMGLHEKSFVKHARRR